MLVTTTSPMTTTQLSIIWCRCLNYWWIIFTTTKKKKKKLMQRLWTHTSYKKKLTPHISFITRYLYCTDFSIFCFFFHVQTQKQVISLLILWCVIIDDDDDDWIYQIFFFFGWNFLLFFEKKNTHYSLTLTTEKNNDEKNLLIDWLLWNFFIVHGNDWIEFYFILSDSRSFRCKNLFICYFFSFENFITLPIQLCFSLVHSNADFFYCT